MIVKFSKDFAPYRKGDKANVSKEFAEKYPDFIEQKAKNKSMEGRAKIKTKSLSSK